MSARTIKTEKLGLRLTRAAKRTLQRAAKAGHKTLSGFVLESALAHTDSTLADRRVFRLDPKRWKELNAALDARAKPHPRRTRLFKEPSVLD